MDFVIGAFVGALIMAASVAISLKREPDINLSDVKFVVLEEKEDDSTRI